MRRFTIAQKGLLILLIPLLYQGALLWVLIGQQRAHSHAQAMAVHTKNVLVELDRIAEATLTVQNEARGMVFFREMNVDPSFGDAEKNLLSSLDALAGLVADNPSHTARVAFLRPHANSLVEWFRAVRAEVGEGRWDAAADLLATRRGVQAVTAMRNVFSELRGIEQNLDARRMETLRQSTERRNSIVVLGFGLNILIGVLAMLFFGHNIGRRFSVLESNVERISRGERLAQPMGGTDELAALDHRFHRMAEALDAARGKERESQASLEARNKELELLNRELDQKSRENEMFVYSVSHDLRSPLVNLQGFSKELGMVRDDLRNLLGGPLDESARARARQMIDRDISESIHYIQTAVSRLGTIIDALLKLSRAGRVEYRFESVDVDPILTRIVVAMRETISERKAEIIVHRPLPAAWGDRTALEQIFANLVGNAVNYLSPERGGRIEIGCCAVPEMENMTVYFVRDNGLGIPAAYLPKLFAAFQRLHGNLAPGEGIGLALVRRAVERHGGRIWVDSEEGVGSTFYVALPQQVAPEPKVAASHEIANVPLLSTTE